MDVNVTRSLRIAFNLDDEDRKALSKAYAIFDKVLDVMNENQLNYLRANADDEGFWDSQKQQLLVAIVGFVLQKNEPNKRTFSVIVVLPASG